MSIKLGCTTLVHIIKWICGKERLRRKLKVPRTKKNSVLEDTKEFYRQCAKPFTDSWREFKDWHNDPVGVSKIDLVRHSASTNKSVEVFSLHSSEEVSLQEFHLKHGTPHQVPLSAFANLPPHMTLSPIGSYRPKPTPRSHSQSSMIESSRHNPWASETKITPYRAGPNNGDADMSLRPLQPFPRSAYSFTEFLPSQESLDSHSPRRNLTEPLLPPQAAWAPAVLQPQRR